MKTRMHCWLALGCLVFLWTLDLHALANRVFVSARSGNDANNCANVLTPCQTFAGAVVQLDPGGEAIVLDSGGYGPVTITQSLTIEAPVGVTAFVHPPSPGDAITVSAGMNADVTLRGLVLNGYGYSGIIVNSVGRLNVENCSISGFGAAGILMLSKNRLNVTGTSIRTCNQGIWIMNTSDLTLSSIDHCHLDENLSYGFLATSTSPGSSTTAATSSTANNNGLAGWVCGESASTGQDVLNLEFCTGSENGADGLREYSGNAGSVARYSNCVFANNLNEGVEQGASGAVETRGNNTITGNPSPTVGTIGSFLPM